MAELSLKYKSHVDRFRDYLVVRLVQSGQTKEIKKKARVETAERVELRVFTGLTSP